MSPYREGAPLPEPEIPKTPWWRGPVPWWVWGAALPGVGVVGFVALIVALAAEGQRVEERRRLEYEARPCVDRVLDPSSWNETGSCRPMQTLQQEGGSWVCRCPKP